LSLVGKANLPGGINITTIFACRGRGILPLKRGKVGGSVTLSRYSLLKRDYLIWVGLIVTGKNHL